MPEQTSSDLIGQRTERLAKAKKLQELSITIYPARTKKTNGIAEVTNKFSEFNGKTVTLAGRMISFRDHGKLAFGNLEDMSGTIQIYLRKDILKPFSKEEQLLGWDELKLLDIGDFIEISGEITKTQREEISILASELKILTKAIRPLPDYREGVKDKEEKFRKRYIDLATSRSQRELFIRKAKFWEVARNFMHNNGFIEVETPILEHKTGGADAKPFKTHHNELDQEFYLRISSELFQKRLIGGGLEKIYTLGPNFRNEGMSDQHSPEYYQLEWYWAYADYRMNMELVRNWYLTIAKEVYGRTKFETRGHKFDLADEWREIDYVQILKETYGIDIFTDSDEQIAAAVEQAGLKLEGDLNRNRLIDNLWKLIRKGISGPAYLINEPKFMSPLAKSKPEDDRLTERFHVIVAGSEQGNGYSEINDPQDQLARFLEQEQMRVAGDDEAQMLDIDFVEMLEYGMPPTSGFGISERIFWFLEDVTAREGTLFPQMKSYTEELNKKIYPGVIRDEITPKSQVRSNILATIKEDNSLVDVESEVTESFPGLGTAYLVIEDLSITTADDFIQNLKKAVKSEIQSKYKSNSDLKEIASIKKFREIFKKTGADPDSTMNSAEALMRRLIKDKDIYNINNLVDLYNSLSVKYANPMAAYDLDKISGKIKLGFAKEGAQITLIGEGNSEVVEAGRLIYFDDQGVLCRDLNYRDADRSKITNTTKRAVIFADFNSETDEIQTENLLSELVEILTSQKIAKVVSYGNTNKIISSNDRSNLSDQSNMSYPSYADTEKLVLDSVKDEYQRHHAKTVSKCLSAYATILKELHPESSEDFDPNRWAVCGLVHDWDYEFDPEGHPMNNLSKLKDKGYPDDIINALAGHTTRSGVTRETYMAKTLLATDELVGLLFAYSKMKNGYQDMEVKGVMKKFKDKAFAAKIDRQEIMTGVEELGISIEEHIGNLLTILKQD